MSDFPIDVIIVEDEEANQVAILGALQLAWPRAKVLGIASSVNEAVSLIQSTKPQLVLLDIRLHDMTGFDLLERFIKHQFDVIIISAFAEFEYARTAVSYGVKEFLLKPVSIEQLHLAISKIQPVSIEPKEQTKLVFSAAHGNQVFIEPSEIIMLVAERSYTVIYLKNNIKHIVSRNLSAVATKLPQLGFFRAHHSNVINISHVTSIDEDRATMCGGMHARIAIRKRGELMKLLKNEQE